MNIMNPVELLDQFLIKQRQEEFARPYHHKWRPSSFGMCFRNQYWTRLHLPETNPPDIYSLRRFWFGHLGHKMLQAKLEPHLVEISFETDDECGTTDFISDTRYYEGLDCIEDFKFSWGYGFKKAQGKDYSIETEKPEYCLQAVRYAMYFRRPYAIIRLFDRGSVKDVEFVLKVENWQAKVEEELRILRDYWARQELPPAQPRAKWNCGYCGYKDKCWELEQKEGRDEPTAKREEPSTEHIF